MVKSPKVIAAFFVVFSLGGLLGWWAFLRGKPLPEGFIQVNGRIEGDRYTVASKLPGRIKKLYAREGDSVREGQLLVELDDAQTTAKVDQAKETVLSLEAQLRASISALEVMEKDVPLMVKIAEANLKYLHSQVETARANAIQAERDLARFENLFRLGAVEKRKYEQVKLNRDVANNQFISAMKSLEAGEKQLQQAFLGYDKIKAKREEIKALEAQLNQAKAVLREAESLLNDLKVYAPSDGTIVNRLVDVGEVVASGTPLFEIINLDRLYLLAYVPEKEIGKVRFGVQARIYVDAFPEESFPATVRYIASKAQFTPKEVQTPDERVKLVYAVRLYLDSNPNHKLSPGLPADAIIRWKEDLPWPEYRRP